MADDLDSFNPCLMCGACCATFRVSFYWSTAGNYQTPLTSTQKVDDYFLCMAGTDQAKPRCVALKGQIGQPISCSLYEQRPTPCRELQAGDDKCLRARKKHGLGPIIDQSR